MKSFIVTWGGRVDDPTSPVERRAGVLFRTLIVALVGSGSQSVATEGLIQTNINLHVTGGDPTSQVSLSGGLGKRRWIRICNRFAVMLRKPAQGMIKMGKTSWRKGSARKSSEGGSSSDAAGGARTQTQGPIERKGPEISDDDWNQGKKTAMNTRVQSSPPQNTRR